MPPKPGAKGGGPSAKTVQKKKDKIIEDKTFGLKNKNKSKKVQAYVEQVKKQVHSGGKRPVTAAAAAAGPKKSKAELEKERLAELNLLFKPVLEKQPPQIIPPGVDPKSVLCQYFAKGTCQKGDKCKFSHDPNIHRKAHKVDLYTDIRGEAAPAESVAPCSHFLDAVEQKRFGFFWVCPNGVTCPQRHCLPKGVVLKEEVEIDPSMLTDTDETPLEQILEEERKKLQGKGTPVTLERFLEWRERKQREKEAKAERGDETAASSDSTSAIKSKSARKALSGRQMFIYRPELFVDDEDAADEDTYAHSEDAPDPDVPVNVIEVTGTSLTRTALNEAAGLVLADQFCWAPIDASLWTGIPLPPELAVKGAA